MSAKLVELIEVEEREGSGKSAEDPIRLVTRWYTKTGELVSERDHWKVEQQERDLNAAPVRELVVEMPLGEGDPLFTWKGDFKPGNTYIFKHLHYEVAAPRRDRE